MLGKGLDGTPEDPIGFIESVLDCFRFANFGSNLVHFSAQLHKWGRGGRGRKRT